jgi:periplasmic mercuric ion binding protein
MTNFKTTRIITAIAFLAIFLSANVAMFAKNEVQEVKIKTSAMCADCKAKIERSLHQTKGVQEAELNLDDKFVTIKYNPAKTSPDKLRKVIAKGGYDADGVKAVKAHKCDEGSEKCKDKCTKDKAKCDKSQKVDPK